MPPWLHWLYHHQKKIVIKLFVNIETFLSQVVLISRYCRCCFDWTLKSRDPKSVVRTPDKKKTQKVKKNCNKYVKLRWYGNFSQVIRWQEKCSAFWQQNNYIKYQSDLLTKIGCFPFSSKLTVSSHLFAISLKIKIQTPCQKPLYAKLYWINILILLEMSKLSQLIYLYSEWSLTSLSKKPIKLRY